MHAWGEKTKGACNPSTHSARRAPLPENVDRSAVFGSEALPTGRSSARGPSPPRPSSAADVSRLKKVGVHAKFVVRRKKKGFGFQFRERRSVQDRAAGVSR